MKIALDRIDSRKLDIELSAEDRIVVGEVVNLRGNLEVGDGVMRVTGAVLERALVEQLRMHLGDLLLATAGKATTFETLRLAYEDKGGVLSIDTNATLLEAGALRISIDDIEIKGGARMQRMQLEVRGTSGSLKADGLELEGFALGIGEFELTAAAVTAEDFAIGWGEKGFQMSAKSLSAKQLQMWPTPDFQIAAGTAAAKSFSIDGGKIHIGTLDLPRAEVSAKLLSAQPDAKTPKAATSNEAPVSSKPIVDFAMLDRLSGKVDVDVRVDVTVPIIGHRKATHMFRIPIEDGTLDYLQLEHNLSSLEDAIIDFAVRDGGLALERVNPLFPARGHGKPIVMWELDDKGLALAESNRVRLSVLPKYRLVTDDEGDDKAEKVAPKPSSGESPLRELDISGLKADLSLAHAEKPESGQIRIEALERLSLRGHVSYEPSVPRPGRLQGSIEGVSLALAELAMGKSHLSLKSKAPVALPEIEVDFAGLDIARAHVILESVELYDIDFA